MGEEEEEHNLPFTLCMRKRPTAPSRTPTQRTMRLQTTLAIAAVMIMLFASGIQSTEVTPNGKINLHNSKVDTIAITH